MRIGSYYDQNQVPYHGGGYFCREIVLHSKFSRISHISLSRDQALIDLVLHLDHDFGSFNTRAICGSIPSKILKESHLKLNNIFKIVFLNDEKKVDIFFYIYTSVDIHALSIYDVFRTF